MSYAGTEAVNPNLTCRLRRDEQTPTAMRSPAIGNMVLVANLHRASKTWCRKILAVSFPPAIKAPRVSCREFLSGKNLSSAFHLRLFDATPPVRASYIRQTSSNTRFTSIRCIQTLSVQGEVRPFSALTHGLQAMPAQNTWLRVVRAAKSRGFSGPNSVTTSIGVSAAKCAGPLSFVTRTSASP